MFQMKRSLLRKCPRNGKSCHYEIPIDHLRNESRTEFEEGIKTSSSLLLPTSAEENRINFINRMPNAFIHFDPTARNARICCAIKIV